MRILTLLIVCLLPLTSIAADLELGRKALEARWEKRIHHLLEQGKLPLIDMETSLTKAQVSDYFPEELEDLDKLGIALVSADGYQRPKDGTKGYRWSDYIIELVNRYPDYFVPTANGGTNPNWSKQKGGKSRHFMDQLEKQVRSGKYYSMGELEFRHYLSNSQCRQNRRNRDVNIPLDSKNGRRLFALGAETGVPFVIHLEPEDGEYATLETMLKQYPEAKVIVAHFGQLRHPEKQKRFSPDHVRHLLETYPNLFFDLATGEPNRRYACGGPGNNKMLESDTVLWAGNPGNQQWRLKPGYRDLLKGYSKRFVFASDYGNGRMPFYPYMHDKIVTFRRLIQDLPDEAKHNIAYRNAWYLLTEKVWSN